MAVKKAAKKTVRRRAPVVEEELPPARVRRHIKSRPAAGPTSIPAHMRVQREPEQEEIVDEAGAYRAYNGGEITHPELLDRLAEING